MAENRIGLNAARARSQYDAPMYRLLMEAYGGNSHMGLFERPDMKLPEALKAANARLSAMVGLSPGQHVVEVACGVGGTARHLVEAHGVAVTATNIAAVQLADARDLTAAAGLDGKIRFVGADFHHLPFADGLFDAWWCQEAMIHATDKRQVLREAIRVLRPGGRLVISDIVAKGARRPDSKYAQGVLAPDLWSVADYQKAASNLNLRTLDAADLSKNVQPTFEAMRQVVLDNRDSFSRMVGEEAVEATIQRYTTFIDAAASGLTGWFCVVFQRES